MSLVTNDTSPMPTAPPPLTFPRLMQGKQTGSVFLVTRRQRAPVPGDASPVYAYDVTCIHHGTLPPAATPWGGAAMPTAPTRTPEPIGPHSQDVSLDNLQDYGNTVFLSNGKA